MADQIEWRNVFSKSANRVGYDHDQAELYVEWHRAGRISIYFPDFPFKTFDELSKSVSVGNMLRDQIQPKYQMRYAK